MCGVCGRAAVMILGSCAAGYVGVLTGMKPGAFSVSVDERGLSDPTSDLVLNLISALQV